MAARQSPPISSPVFRRRKTTAIVHWLKHKPADEYWAVLVNEFGEVGIDGALLKGQGR